MASSELNTQPFRFSRGIAARPCGVLGSVVTIGCFDGVHRGHQLLVEHVIEQARARGLRAVAVTFDPHPQEYFSTEACPPRLMRIRDKVEALRALGVDEVVCLRFDDQLRSLNAEAFVEQVLINRLATRHLVIGDDFRFGSDRSGNHQTLQSNGERWGFTVEDSPTVTFGDQRVSSTRIRALLGAADFAAAAELLGRPFVLTGRVIHGQKLGRELGYATANINLQRYRAPLSGVFAVTVEIEGQRHIGSANVGVRPTVGDLDKPILEVHLLDFTGELYGQRLAVEFVHKVREEQKFDSFDALVEQIGRDVATTLAYFKAHPTT